MIAFRPTAKLDKQATVILFDQDQVKKRSLPQINNRQIREEILTLIKNGIFRGENQEVFPLGVKKQIILLVGVGKKEKTSLTALRITVRNVLLSNHLKKIKDVELITHEQSEDVITALIEAVLIGTYSWDKYKSKEEDKQKAEEKNIYLITAKKKEYDDIISICNGVTLTRNLVNENADVTNSTYIERVIKELIRGRKNTSIEILNQKELKAKGLNLHLAVNQGSPNEPKLIIVRYRGAATDGNFTALVGKGITFDTGGLNLKPTGSMETMRCDMSGAASVIGTLKNAIALNLRKNVIFAVGIAENVTGSRSYKPGDIFKCYSGKTVEIGNTDAEGRLVLADAIAYVVKNYKPARLIDIATLTGACVVALGYDYSGLVTNNDDLSRALVHASNATDDRVWRLPSYPEIKDYVKSPIADLKNTSVLKGAGGAITAAEFLRQFTGSTIWAHLDIAGTAFTDSPKGRWYYSHGATGAGVRLLTRYLLNN